MSALLTMDRSIRPREHVHVYIDGPSDMRFTCHLCLQLTEGDACICTECGKVAHRSCVVRGRWAGEVA